MKETRKGLLSHPFFKDFQSTHIELLADCANAESFAAGGFIFHEGEPADRLYLLQTGKIAIVLHMPGQDPTAIMTLGPGGVVGWSWLFPPYRWHFCARVIEDTTAITLNAKCMMEKCREDYQLGFELMWRCGQVMEERLHATRAQLLNHMNF